MNKKNMKKTNTKKTTKNTRAKKMVSMIEKRALTPWQIVKIKEFVEKTAMDSMNKFKKETSLSNSLFSKMVGGAADYAENFAVEVAETLMWEAAKEDIMSERINKLSKKKK